MPKTGFVHNIDAFAFPNSWNMQPGDWDQLRGLIQGAATGVTLHPLVAPLALLIPPGPPISNFIIGKIVTDQIVNNVRPGIIGLCGGMTFAAADYYAHSWLPSRGEFATGTSPRNPEFAGPEETTLRTYIWNRLLDSLRGNVAVNTLIWMGVVHNIFPFSRLGGQQWLRDRSRDELRTIKASIDRGQPCSIGLVGTTSNPMDNHQVLVTGYDDPGTLGPNSVCLYVYEPNGPNQEQTIDFDFSGGHPARESVASEVRGPLQGFFAALYAPNQPPPALVMSAGLAATPASGINLGGVEKFTMTVKNQGFGDTPPLKLYIAGRAGGTNVDAGGEAAATLLPMREARQLPLTATMAGPLGPRHYFASMSVEAAAAHQAWRPPADIGTGNTFIDLNITVGVGPAPVNIHLRANNGQYVSAANGGGTTVKADRSSAGAWETFQLADQNGAALRSGDPVALRTSNGQVVSAENGGGQHVVANRTVVGGWETFSILRTDGLAGDIVNGQQVALRVNNGQFFCAEGGGGGDVMANRSAIGVWETFTLEIV